MKAQDIIYVNVTGTNVSTRHTKSVSERFNGEGLPLDSNGQVDAAKKDRLRNLPGTTASLAPDFPNAEFAAAQAKGETGKAEIKQILLAYTEQVAAWEKSSGGGDERLQIIKSVIEYTKEFQGFQEVDGDHFVIKPENLALQNVKLPDGRAMITVTGTAVFGAEA